MTTTSERWSVMTVDEKFEELTARASALNARQDALLARMKVFSARSREEPLTETDAAQFGALITAGDTASLLHCWSSCSA